MQNITYPSESNSRPLKQLEYFFRERVVVYYVDALVFSMQKKYAIIGREGNRGGPRDARAPPKFWPAMQFFLLMLELVRVAWLKYVFCDSLKLEKYYYVMQ